MNDPRGTNVDLPVNDGLGKWSFNDAIIGTKGPGERGYSPWWPDHQAVTGALSTDQRSREKNQDPLVLITEKQETKKRLKNAAFFSLRRPVSAS